MSLRARSISSESDPEEFFDAEEATPSRPSRQPAELEDHNEGEGEENAMHKLEEEEKRLLAQQRDAGRRRLEEEGELQRKLDELEKRKEEEIEKEKQRQEAARRAAETEERRRKLEEMRQYMMDDTTPTRAPPKPPRLYADAQEAQFKGGGHTNDLDPPSKMLSEHSTEIPSQESSARIGACYNAAEVLKPGQTTLLGSSQYRVNINNSSVIAACSEVRPGGSAEAYFGVDRINLNDNGAPVDEKMLYKNIPTLASADKSETNSQASSSASDVNYVPGGGSDNLKEVDEGTGEFAQTPMAQEPDIIQSTKASSLPRQPVFAHPVPPPRRKKKNKASFSSEDVETFSISSSGSVAVGDLETPSTTVYNLTRDLEESLGVPRGAEPGQSLDLNSAIQGDRLVTAQEDEAARGFVDDQDYHITTKITSDFEASDGQDAARCRSTGGLRMEDLGDMVEVSLIRCKTVNGTYVEEVIPMSMRRPRTNSGSRFLTDTEILDQVMVLNLDTGEQVPLSSAEDKLPRCLNPLSLHIMRRTKEYSSDSSLHTKDLSDDDDKSSTSTGRTVKTVKPKKRRAKIKRLIGKTVSKIKSVSHDVFHGEDPNNSSDDDELFDGRRMIKVKASHSHKGPYDFDLLVPVQDLSGEHTGAVWTMKFSHCGRLLATGGQDNLLRVWVLKDAYAYFDDMRQKYSEAAKLSPAESQDSLNSQGDGTSEGSMLDEAETDQVEEEDHTPFRRKPFCVYRGHAADLLDVSWSKNYFILSSSMDKTVRLWHVSRKECLCCFQHIDFVTAIAFHPKDDRYFLSGSLDGKLRLWNIPEKKVALWNEVSGQSKLITAANFCMDGKVAVVGTYDGRCILYTTDHLKYYTQIHVRSTRGKNARGRKITGVEPIPGEDKILVTSNDSRIRLYDLRDLTLTCKYKGCANNSSQIKASFSHTGKYIVCGSEDRFVYIWRTHHEFYKFYSVRRDRNDYWEGIKAHMAVVTAAIFAPNPRLVIKPQFEFMDSEDKESVGVRGEVLISADYSGAIKVFINKFKPGSG